MSSFTFNRGTWEDGSPLPDWNDDEHSGTYQERIGYTSRAAFYGHEHAGHIEIYESSNSKSFYASVSPTGGSCFEVFLPDFPSFMMFIRDHAAAFSAESTNVVQQEIFEVVGKLFRLQHGHSADAICQQCDPAGWAESVRRKAR